jgi:UPF0755 protein
MKKFLLIIIPISLITLTSLILWSLFLAAPGTSSNFQIISFSEGTPKILVSEKLKKEGYIKNEIVLEFLLKSADLPAGGYELSNSLNVLEVAKALNNGPTLLWVTVTPGMRKEQIAEKLKIKFNWTSKDTTDFLSFPEGQYFPDTYLVPKAVSGQQLAVRMNNNFNEKFAPLAPKFLAQNIKNDTALKIASLIEREAAGAAQRALPGGESDMPLISGIIWNRLLKNMRLQIDAANQYIIGKSGDWWPAFTSVSARQALKIDSPYNLYLHKGLPPTPICNPSLEAIEAVLNPAQTDCLFYLHDKTKQIHCSVTYEEHLKKIALYLQN